MSTGSTGAPHDIRVRELGTGKSRLETAKNHGINFQVVRDIGVADGIDAALLQIVDARGPGSEMTLAGVVDTIVRMFKEQTAAHQ